MKKLMLFAAVLLAAGTAFNSCDKDERTEAESAYFASFEGIEFTDSADVDFYNYISDAFDELDVTGFDNQFSESYTVDYSENVYYLYTVCDQKAKETLSKRMENVTLAKVKNAIFAQHSDSMSAKGYTSASAIPLDPFTAVLGLQSSWRAQADTLHFEIK